MFIQKITETKSLVEFHTTSDLSNEYLSMLLSSCEGIVGENKPYSENYDVQENPYSLIHLLDNQKRFQKGKGAFHLLIENDKILVMSGIYLLYPEIAIFNCRAWKHPEARTRVNLINHILSRQINLAYELGAKQIWATANEYNKDFLIRSIPYLNRHWPKNVHFDYAGFTEIKFVKQHVISSILC